MREYRSADGERRLWFNPGEIEDIMEHELHEARMFPTSIVPVVDIESFIEFYLHAPLDQYAKLDADVLGETRFAKGGQPAVFINRELTKQAEGELSPSGILGRWRATLAHEAAHVVLHRSLYELSLAQGSLWNQSDSQSPSLARCFRWDIVTAKTSGDWREVQANRGMAGLLMPERPFTDLIRKLLGARRSADLLITVHSMNPHDFKELIMELGRRCEVSQQAAYIRMKSLGFVRDAGEQILGSVAD